MDSIERIKTCAFSSLVSRSVAVMVLLLLSAVLIAQEGESSHRRLVEILNADIQKGVKREDRKELIGNVYLKHKDLYMRCDSAWYYDKTNQVFAFSNIHIFQGDTIHIYGQNLTYNGDTGKAVMTDSVELVDKETQLFTDRIDYDVNTQIAEYNTGGRILNGDNILTSITGIYFSDRKMMHFRDSVKIVNPDYVMRADTLRYNTLSEIVYFEGPSEAIGDSIYLYCENGWSDTKKDVSRLMKNAVLDNRKQRLSGDTLYYDQNKGYGEGFGNVIIADTTNDVFAAGNYAWYYKDPENFMITRNASFTILSKDDTLTLKADTLRAVPQYDTTGVSHRLLKAYNKCRIYSREVQGICDSLAYSFLDSVVRLYTGPVLWSDENQLTADSMALFTRNKAPDRMELYSSPFIVSTVDSLRFNQMKGKNMIGYFKESKLFKVIITGNGETVYYVIDGNDLVGINKAKCASIEIYLDDGKIKEIWEKGSPDGIMEPPQKSIPSELNLENLNWMPDKRPDESLKSNVEGFMHKIRPKSNMIYTGELKETDVPER